MAISFTNISVGTGTSGTDAANFETNYFNGVAGKLYLFILHNGHTAGGATSPNAGPYWVDSLANQLANLTLVREYTNGTRRISVYSGVAPITGLLKIYTGWATTQHNFIVQLVEVSGATAVVQSISSNGSGTPASVTLPVAIGAGNATLAAISQNSSSTNIDNLATAIGSQLSVTSPSIRHFAEYSLTGTNPLQFTVGAGVTWEMIGLEIGNPPSATLSGTGSLTAVGTVKTFGAASLTGTGSMSVVGSLAGYAAPDARVYLETTPGTWVELTDDLIQGSTDRGRNNELDKYKTGTAALIFRNNERKYDPVNADGPLYGFLDVRHRMKIEAFQGGNTYPIFLGYIDEIQEGRALSNTRATVIIKLSDFFKVLNKAVVNGTDFASQLPGDRINDVLDLVDLDVAYRDIDTGSTTLQAMTDVSSTLLSHLQTVAQTEFGDFFVKANGVVRFKSRDAALDEVVQATFGEAPTELHYNSLTPQYNDSLIRNPVSVDRVGGIRQTVEDTALSAVPPTGYGKNHYSLSGTYHNSDGDALALAQYILERYKVPKRRVIGLGFGPVPYIEGPALYPQILGRELTERIEVVERPLGIGSEIRQGAVIEGISHDFSPGRWVTRWNVSPGFVSGDFWILGVSALGDDTTLYF